MSFPQTREILIYRIAASGNERDWRQFLSDYWLPVCRFAQQQAKLQIEDAEDVAAETFQAILRNQLLQRWVSHRASKLRVLLCTVVRHVLSNRARVQRGRHRLLREKIHKLLARTDLLTIRAVGDGVEDIDQFYAAWVEGILLQALEALVDEYRRNGKGDYFRVLHGRVCKKMTAVQIAKALGIKTTDAQNYYKAARKRLETKLEQSVRAHVHRYCDSQDLGAEFDLEWCQLGQYLADHGGLEQAIAKAYENTRLVDVAQRQAQAITSVGRRLMQVLPKASELSTENVRRPRECKKK
ncbi:MAG: RNA polymerase sigma factor [Planctomycetota bacterium]|jgi:RNA polymerase sigma factor (sigma-70 family)